MERAQLSHPSLKKSQKMSGGVAAKFCPEPGHEPEINSDDGTDGNIGGIVAFKLQAGPDDGKGESGGDKAKRKIGDKERGGGAEDGRGMAGGKALESPPEGMGDAVKTVGHVGIGPGPSEREAEAVVEEARQGRAKKTDDRDASPGAAFRAHAVEPDGQGEREVVGRVIAP